MTEAPDGHAAGLQLDHEEDEVPLASLPQAPITQDLSDVATFLADRNNQESWGAVDAGSAVD